MTLHPAGATVVNRSFAQSDFIYQILFGLTLKLSKNRFDLNA